MPFLFSIGQCCCKPKCTVQVVSGDTTDAANHTQTLFALGNVNTGNFELTFKSATGYALQYNATAAQVQAELAKIPTVGTGNVSCTGGPLPAQPITITLQGTLANDDQPLIGVVSAVQCCGSHTLTVELNGLCEGTSIENLTPDPSAPSGQTITVTDVTPGRPSADRVGPFKCIATTPTSAPSCAFKNLPNGTYQVTVTVPDGWICESASQTVEIQCLDATVTFNFRPNTVLLIATASLCANNAMAFGQTCPPTAQFPVTVTATGGGGGGNCTITSIQPIPGGAYPYAYGCTIVVPRVLGGYTLTVEFSAPSFVSQTISVTVPDGFSGIDVPGCFVLAFASLESVYGPCSICMPAVGCVRPFPAAMNVTVPVAIPPPYGPLACGGQTVTCALAGCSSFGANYTSDCGVSATITPGVCDGQLLVACAAPESPPGLCALVASVGGLAPCDPIEGATTSSQVDCPDGSSHPETIQFSFQEVS